MSNPLPKMQMPAEMAVIVCEVREHGNLWPLLRIEQRSDQHVQFTSGADRAPLGLRLLQQASQLVLNKTTELAAAQIAEKIAAGTMNLAATTPQTAAPAVGTAADVPLATGAAASNSYPEERSTAR